MISVKIRKGNFHIRLTISEDLDITELIPFKLVPPPVA